MVWLCALSIAINKDNGRPHIGGQQKGVPPIEMIIGVLIIAMSISVEKAPALDGATPTLSIIDEAASLYDVGMNVFPVQPGSKEPFGKHGFLDTTRLYRLWLPSLMDHNNLAVSLGRLSNYLAIIDCDSLADYERYEAEFQRRGLYPWVRNSIRGGKFWLRCSEGEIENGKYRDTLSRR